MEETVLEDKRICVKCGTTESYQWRKSLCMKCYRKHFWPNYKISVKKDNDKRNPRHLRFKDKIVVLPFNPRKGICSWCGKKGYTAIHHIEYHDNNPLKSTVEICRSCHLSHHLKQHWKNGIFNEDNQKRNRDSKTGRFTNKKLKDLGE